MAKTSLLRLAFRESPAPQIVTEQRHIKFCNKSFASLFGYSADELVGELTFKLYPSQADYSAIGDRALKALGDDTTYVDERFMQHRSGEIFWARARGVTLTPQDPYALMIWNFERIHRYTAKGASLTSREQQVASLIVNGLTCKEVARELDISHRTAEVHRYHVMHKLDAKNTAELVSKIIPLTE